MMNPSPAQADIQTWVCPKCYREIKASSQPQCWSCREMCQTWEDWSRESYFHVGQKIQNEDKKKHS